MVGIYDIDLAAAIKRTFATGGRMSDPVFNVMLETNDRFHASVWDLHMVRSTIVQGRDMASCPEATGADLSSTRCVALVCRSFLTRDARNHELSVM
jgi:hypothetical protein